ncbi:MAG: response regulator [Cyanophyceae cyanobacterium]
MGYGSIGQSASKSRVLVVDDSLDNLLLIQGILEAEGQEIILAKDGSTALELVKQNPPHLILLDVMMPEMDGFEVTRRIRENRKLPFIPILLITAYDQPSAVRALDGGADDFIRKPVDVDELLARVRSLLRLKHSVDEKEQMALQREDFVSRLTHDLRTPLVAAERMLELVEQGALGSLSPSLHEAIATMHRSNHNLLAMVNTLLEVYRYEAGRKTFNFSQVDLQVLVAEVVQELAAIADVKGLTLSIEREGNGKAVSQTTVNGGSNAKFVVLGDRLELRRLMTNIIGNGLKFTNQGSVTVHLTTKSDLELRSWVVVSVQDTGPGISDAEQAVLFERFRTGRHKEVGSGLGLHLSRQIAEAHQGHIEVQSTLGQGSVFVVYLPAQRFGHSLSCQEEEGSLRDLDPQFK